MQNKLKTCFSVLLTIVILSCATLFSACNDKNIVNMNVYFKPTVNTQIYENGTKSYNLTISDITSKSAGELKQYIYYEITADNSWIYGMYIESISFLIYSNQTREVEYNISFTGFEHGTETITSSTRDFIRNQYPISLKENQSVLVKINVNDTIYLSGTNSVLKFLVSDAYTEFNLMGENNNFMYSIYGLEIVGYHKR